MRRFATRRRLFSSSALKSYPRSLPLSLKRISARQATHDSDPAIAASHLVPDVVSRAFSNTASEPGASSGNDAPELPPNLDALPPPQILEDIRVKVRMSFHPATQSKALSVDGKEPTVALYCPIEGGSYVIDETVRQLANTEGAELEVLDGLQLAGGVHGKYGTTIRSFKLSPDEFYESSFENPDKSNEPQTPDAADASAGPVIKIIAPSLPFFQSRSQPPTSSSPRKLPSPHSDAQSYTLFKLLINRKSESSKKRIIYIRDFQHLSDTAPTWFPGLVKAVRERRTGETEGSDISPTIIVLGVTPKVVQSESTSPNGEASNSAHPLAGLGFNFFPPLNMMRSPQLRRSSSTGGPSATDADEYKEKAREERLKERLTDLQEEGEDAVRDELPEFEYTLVSPPERVVDQSRHSTNVLTSDSTSESTVIEAKDEDRDGGLWYVFCGVKVQPFSSSSSRFNTVQRKVEELPPDLREIAEIFKDSKWEEVIDSNVTDNPESMDAQMKKFLLHDGDMLRFLRETTRDRFKSMSEDSAKDADTGEVEGKGSPENVAIQAPSSIRRSTVKTAPFRRTPLPMTATVSEPYTRVAAVLPSKRSLVLESLERCHTRREVNRLLLRMVLAEVEAKVPEGTGLLEKLHLKGIDQSVGWGVTAIEGTSNSQGKVAAMKDGGSSLEQHKQSLREAVQHLLADRQPKLKEEKEELRLILQGTPQDMWKEFSERILHPKDLTEMVERALSDVMSNGSSTKPEEATSPSKGKRRSVSSTSSTAEISWATLAQSHKALRDRRASTKSIIETMLKTASSGGSSGSLTAAEIASTNIINQVKNDPSLDSHEERLLECIVEPTTMPTSFKEIHLPERTIDAVRTIVSLPILYPDVFTEGILKTHSMTGALLLGPPGVGKTLLARAVAKESGARMMVVKASDVEDMYVGEGEKLVKSVFTLARRLSPCVVFLDEVDALFASRESRGSGGAAAAHRGVITEFMQEMDGLKTNRKDGNVIVIGATNRPFDLDDAVLRRLPRRLLIDLPTEKDRKEILKILLRDEVLAPDIDLSALAKQTETFSGSDLKHLCVSAALDSAKENLDLPWKEKTPQSSPEPLKDLQTPSSTPSTSAVIGSSVEQRTPKRTLSLRHFTKALTEITPSSSESLGTLNDLRKWNEEFGEGYKDKTSRSKRRRWGDKFGFGGKEGGSSESDGRVVPEVLTS
ncbi:hypothetical protein FRC02_004510 [Tulasnella sp. 418]|nr:hypothetical protein FRC02_004510 [Tulasnella sp. 418]